MARPRNICRGAVAVARKTGARKSVVLDREKNKSTRRTTASRPTQTRAPSPHLRAPAPAPPPTCAYPAITERSPACGDSSRGWTRVKRAGGRSFSRSVAQSGLAGSIVGRIPKRLLIVTLCRENLSSGEKRAARAPPPPSLNKRAAQIMGCAHRDARILRFCRRP
jgi:hypothetical protein